MERSPGLVFSGTSTGKMCAFCSAVVYHDIPSSRWPFGCWRKFRTNKDSRPCSNSFTRAPVSSLARPFKIDIGFDVI